MKYHIAQSCLVDNDIATVIALISKQLISLNMHIIEQTESRLRFRYAGNFLRATHPVAWISEGIMLVVPKSELPLPGLVEISFQINISRIRRFLILFPLLLCGGLTMLAYFILGSSIQEIIQALGLMYVMVCLSMLLGYIFVKQIVRRFFQTLCETLPPAGSYSN